MKPQIHWKSFVTVSLVSDTKNDDTLSLDPIQGVLEILERAQMTGTNKLGLLLVLLELAPERIDENAPIPRKQLTEKYLEIHWEHARPYGQPGKKKSSLRQSSSKKDKKEGLPTEDTTAMQQIHLLRECLEKNGRGDLQNKVLEVVRGRIDIEKEEWWKKCWDEAVSKTKRDLWRNPVDKLQYLPGKPRPFLFEQVSVNVEGSGKEEVMLEFLPGVAKTLTEYSGALRPLIEFRFVELVARINKASLGYGNEDLIREHLFGKKRSMPPDEIREGLVRLQDKRCIFSGSPLNINSNSLDHVLPWSRTRLSQIENFVVTTHTINSSKCDSLLGPSLFKEWLWYLKEKAPEMRELAIGTEDIRWPTDLERVCRTAFNIYKALDPATGVWQGKEKGVQPIGIEGKRKIEELLKGFSVEGVKG